MFSVKAEAGIDQTVGMLDGGFFLPLLVNKIVDFGGAIVRDCHKVFSVKAETGIVHAGRMLDGGFFLPLPVIKPVDFGIARGCHKVFSVGAETGTDNAVRMLDGGEYRFTRKSFCSAQYLGNRPA